MSELTYLPNMSQRVGLLKIYPGFPVEAYKSLFDRALTDALILETFGAGNAPSDNAFRKLISHYIEAGGIVLNITQCSSGSVQQGKYETSSFFSKIGVISGKDLTTEAALTKLMFLLANEVDKKKLVEELEKSICGELTE